MQALERKKQDDKTCGEIETHNPGYPSRQDTFYVGTIESVGRIYQHTFVDTYSKWANAKLYPSKTPITGADLLNDRGLPFFAPQEMGLIRILIDRGTEYCGKQETHDYELYLGINDIEHTKPERIARRQTASANASTKPFCTRFTMLRSVANYANPWRSFRPIWMSGWSITTPSGLTKGRCAVAGRPCNLSLRANSSGRKRSDSSTNRTRGDIKTERLSDQV